MSASVTEPRHAPPSAFDLAALPANILMNFIVLTLAPMLLTAAGADIGFARLAVLETIKGYNPRSQPDLLAVAQIVGCGLAALGSLGLSMTGDLPLPMILRLRGSANALNRTAEHHRRTRPEPPQPPAEPHFGPLDPAYEAEVLTNLADSEKRFAGIRAAPPPAATPPAATPPAAPPRPAPIAETPVPDTAERQHQNMWARSMINVAKRFTAGLADLPPRERQLNLMRAEALSRCANDLLAGDVAPRLRPGDLDAIIQADIG